MVLASEVRLLFGLVGVYLLPSNFLCIYSVDISFMAEFGFGI